MKVFVNTKDISERLGLTKSQAGNLFRKAKKHFEEQKINLIDSRTLPTRPFIEYMVTEHKLNRKDLEVKFDD